MTDYLSRKIKIVSFIAILLVFFQHAINFTGYIDPQSVYIGKANGNTIIQYILGYGLARPAVALFFFLSGFLFFRNFDLSKTIKKQVSRVRSLFIPYVLWNVLAIVLVIFFQITPFTSSFLSSFYTGYLPGRTVSEYLGIVINHGVAFPLWFVSDLLIYTLLAPVLYILVRYAKLLVIFLLCYIWLFQIPMPPYLSFANRGLIFYVTGAYIAILTQNFLTKIILRRIAIPLIVIWILMLMLKTFIAFYNTSLSSYLFIFDSVSIIFGSLAIWSFYDLFEASKVFIFIDSLAPFTFFIYASHEPLLEVLKIIMVQSIGLNTVSQLFTYISVPILITGICLAYGFLLKRYLPSIYLLLSGGR